MRSVRACSGFGVFNLTNIDRWFLVQIEELVRLEEKVAEVGITGLNADFLRQLKRKGFADARLAKLAGVREAEIRKLRDQYDLHPVYKRVDTCAAEFATDTAYMYSTYEEECEANPSTDREKSWCLAAARTVSVRYRIRLLLRTRLAGAARRRLRNHYG